MNQITDFELKGVTPPTRLLPLFREMRAEAGVLIFGKI